MVIRDTLICPSKKIAFIKQYIPLSGHSDSSAVIRDEWRGAIHLYQYTNVERE